MRTSDGSVTVLGDVVNETSRPVYAVQATVSYFNATGERLSTSVGQVFLRRIDPGQVSPFQDSVFDSEIAAEAVRYEVALKWGNSSVIDYQNIQVVSAGLQTGTNLEVVGEIANNQARPARGIVVVITFYGEGGRVVEAVSEPLSGTVLAPNARAPFRIAVSPPAYSRFLVQSQAMIDK
jgi:hypothetical protein